MIQGSGNDDNWEPWMTWSVLRSLKSVWDFTKYWILLILTGKSRWEKVSTLQLPNYYCCPFCRGLRTGSSTISVPSLLFIQISPRSPSNGCSEKQGLGAWPQEDWIPELRDPASTSQTGMRGCPGLLLIPDSSWLGKTATLRKRPFGLREWHLLLLFRSS